MEEKWYTVEQISQMLRLHPKTVRRYITEGRLRANKMGKSYRVGGHDLSVFMETEDITPSGTAEEALPAIDVSAVADITVRSRDEADRIERTLLASMNAKDQSLSGCSANIQRSANGNQVRVMLWGPLRFVTTMLEFLSALDGHDE